MCSWGNLGMVKGVGRVFYLHVHHCTGMSSLAPVLFANCNITHAGRDYSYRYKIRLDKSCKTCVTSGEKDTFSLLKQKKIAKELNI